MKAKIRHVISPPIESPTGLRDRIINSISPIVADDTALLGNDDILPAPSYHGKSNKTNSQYNSATASSSMSTNDSKSLEKRRNQLHADYHQRIISQVNQSLETRIDVLEIHPCKPLICYVDTYGNLDGKFFVARSFGSTSSSNKSGSNNTNNPTAINTMLKQRIVLQNHISNETIVVISVIDIIQQYLAQGKMDTIKNSNSKIYSSNSSSQTIQQIQQTMRAFGFIKSIQFMDLHILQQHTGRSSINSRNDCRGNSPPYLILHFDNHILLYPIGYNSPTPNTMTSSPSSTTSPINEIIEISAKSTLNKSKISSNHVIPIISNNLLAIGCSDGAMRFYSIMDQKVVKSVRGPNGKSDPVVGVISLNQWDWSSMQNDHLEDYYYYHDDDDDENKNHRSSNNTYLTWIMTICASGTAYIWELQVGFHDSTPGQVKKFNIRPPLVKLDCFSYLTSVIQSSHSNSSLMSPSALISNNYHNNIVQRNGDGVKYDIDRQMLFWTVLPSQHNHIGQSKTYVVAWDVSREKVLSTQKSQRLGVTSSDSAQHTPLHYPQGAMQIPTSSSTTTTSSTTTPTTTGDRISNHTMISGIVHPTFPIDGAYTCLLTSEDGNISIVSASYQHRSCGNDHSYSKKIEVGSIYNHFQLSTMKRTADEKVLGNLRFLEDEKLKVYKVVCSSSRPDIVVMSTNSGFVVITLNEEDALLTGSLHSCFTSAKANNSSGFIGAGGNILLIKDSSVYKARIDFSPSSKIPNPIGSLRFQDPVLFYKSPPPMHKSADFQARPKRIPPRMLPSPSGNFLCLFWHSENRYEIIHNSSITNAERKSTRDNGPAYSPAVDSGCNVLSFAWIGDQDIFALLYPPEFCKGDSGSYETKVKVRTLALDEKEDEEDLPIDPSKLKPRVELKVLVGVNKDAVELSSSVAAATATFLGTLALRGRHSPTCLFGGPVLCVASLSQDKDSSQMDGMAYFYSRRINSEENDNRASSFTSVGPALPFPDLVVWDDDGRLCAVIVGRRIAIYLAERPNFTLLCTSHLGTANGVDVKVQSAQFVHGVLFLSTQTSIQCVFLGDTEHDDVVCEADSFILVSNDASFNTVRGSIKPQPQPMTLVCPSILGYFNGSLLVSTVNGIHAISLSHPLIRIGALLASGHYNRAQRWFNAIRETDHEALANFLERRGYPEMSVELSGLSLESAIELSIRYCFTDHLVTLIEAQGLSRIFSIDDTKFMGDNLNQSTLFSVCVFLLGENKDDLVVYIANECLTFGERGRREAFTLGILLIDFKPNEARHLITIATSKRLPSSDPLAESWYVAKYVKDKVLQ